jgi:hypothetical protein
MMHSFNQAVISASQMKIHQIKNIFFIIPTDAHYYKSVEILKQLKYPVRTAQ